MKGGLEKKTKKSQMNINNKLEASPSCGAFARKTEFSIIIDFYDVAPASNTPHSDGFPVKIDFTL